MNKIILIAACATISACDMPAFNLSLPNLGDAKSETEAVVTRDEITLVGPRGFCVDPQSSNRDVLSAFIVFGNCAAITDSNRAPQPTSNAIVTSAVQLADPTLPRINASGAQLSQFFDSDVGHILLSRDNNPISVDVIESGVTANGAFFIYVMDTGEGAPDGTEDTYWRAYLDAKNSVVTLSVLSLEANPLSKDEGLDILRNFTNAIQSVPSNAITGSAQITAPDVLPAQEDGIIRPVARPVLGTSPTIEPVIKPKKTRIGLLDRLFG